MKKTYRLKDYLLTLLICLPLPIFFRGRAGEVRRPLRERTVEDACPYRALSALSKNTSYLVGEGLAPPEKLKRKIKNGRGKPLPYMVR